MNRCCCFASPGPPFYAARCILEAGHAGECQLPSAEECQKAFYGSVEVIEAEGIDK